MKRFLFMSALASVTLASCVNDEAMENTSKASDQKITFNAPVIGGATRAVNYRGEIETYPKNESFNVYAVWHKESFTTWAAGTEYMDKIKVSNAEYDTDDEGSTGWTFTGENKYYWPEGGGYLTFAAYSPADAIGTITYEAGTGLKIVGFEVEANASNQYDLLYSKRTYNQTKDNQTDSNDTYDGVDIVFQHALSSIQFAARTENDYSTTTIELTGIKLYGVYSKGDFNEGVDETKIEEDVDGNPTTVNRGTDYYNSPKWTNQSEIVAEASAYVAYENTEGLTLKKTAQTLNGTTGQTDLILLPQTLPVTGATVIVDYTIKTTGGEIPQQAKVEIDELVSAWEPGKRYTYTIIFGLDQIYFAPSVDSWVDVPGSGEKLEQEL